MASGFVQSMSYASAYTQGNVRESQIGFSIQGFKSIRDVDANKTKLMQENYVTCNESSEVVSSTSIDVAGTKPAICENSLSNMISVVIRNEGDDKTMIQCNINQDNRHSSYSINVSPLHGKVLGDSQIGGCSFSADEKYFCYIAQTKPKKLQSYLDSEKSRKSPSTSAKVSMTNIEQLPVLQSNTVNPQCVYEEDWGEGYTGVVHNVLCVLNIQSGIVQVVNIAPPVTLTSTPPIHCPATVFNENGGMTIGQPVFLMNQSYCGGKLLTNYKIIFTKYDDVSKKLGLIYCQNRSCALFSVDVTDLLTIHPVVSSLVHAVCLTESLAIARCCRVYHQSVTTVCSDSTTTAVKCIQPAVVIFIGLDQPMSSHNGCFQMYTLPLIHKENTLSFSTPCCVIDVVNTPHYITSTATNSTDAASGSVFYTPFSFPGLFSVTLPEKCFLLQISTSRDSEFNQDNRTCDTLMVMFSCYWGSRELICSINLPVGRTCADSEQAPSFMKPEVKCHDELNLVLSSVGSCTLLEVNPILGTVLAHVSSCLEPARLVLWQWNDEQNVFIIRMKPTNKPSGYSIATAAYPITNTVTQSENSQSTSYSTVQSIHSAMKQIHCSLAKMHQNILSFETDGCLYECIFISPPGHYIPSLHGPPCFTNDCKASTSLPSLLIVPHGGPHSTFTTAYTPQYLHACVALNTCICLVNYRGSLGFGKASVESLLGNIGRNDIDDCVHIVRYILAQGSLNDVTDTQWVDPARVGIVGGSHGGFLTGHALGQFPDLFRAGCMRNPVVDITTMVGVSDIPDWCVVEACGALAYDFHQYTLPLASHQITSDLVKQMSLCSPIRYIEQVRVPLLICLGGKDRRVPPSQGLQYFHTLMSIYRQRQQQIDSLGLHTTSPELQCLWFAEDCHALDLPRTEVEHWTAIIQWFTNHL